VRVVFITRAIKTKTNSRVKNAVGGGQIRTSRVQRYRWRDVRFNLKNPFRFFWPMAARDLRTVSGGPPVTIPFTDGTENGPCRKRAPLGDILEKRR